jgi:hypothetical protein
MLRHENERLEPSRIRVERNTPSGARPEVARDASKHVLRVRPSFVRLPRTEVRVRYQ